MSYDELCLAIAAPPAAPRVVNEASADIGPVWKSTLNFRPPQPGLQSR